MLEAVRQPAPHGGEGYGASRHRFASLELEHFPRLVRLRRELLAARPAICIERARLFTEYFRREGFDESRPVLRQALALSYALDRLPTAIFDDELIVGSTTRHRLGALMYPEFMAQVIWPELPTIANRSHEPVSISDQEADLLADEIFPFWRDRTVHEHARREGGDPESLRLAEHLVFYLLSMSAGVTHVVPDYPRLVGRGLASMVSEAATRERQAGDPEAAEFHRAVGIVLRGVVRFAGRYALACEERAVGSTPERADELRGIAKILRRVPARPARTLHEALQSIWIVQVALHQENIDFALSFGRLDQFLYPLYRDDVAAGRVDELRAGELLGSFFIKMGDHTPLVPLSGQDIVGGVATNQAVTIGGLRPDAGDGVNELTYLVIKMSELLAMREPNLCARLQADSGPGYRRALIESIYRTGASPALYNDEAVIESLTAHGVSLADARDYGVIGCVETNSAGRTMGMTGAILLNLAAVLELALNDGIHPGSGVRIGPATGHLEDIRTFDELRAAFERQLEHMVDLACEGNSRLADAHAVLHPTPLLSSLLEGTADSGRDASLGGAKYNSHGVAIIGLADVADSLTALKQIVFDQGRISAGEVSAALAADFKGHEKVRARLSRKAAKYGTDDPTADRMAAYLVEKIGKTFGRHEAPHHGRYHVGYWSITFHAGFGALTGSLPSGRRRGEPLASGATPVSGVALKGPTASLASTAKLPARYMANCIANNHKIPRSLLGQPDKRELVENLIKAYFKLGGMQVQFTVQDRQTLLDAQENPDAYRDLLVRVSGYSAYFRDLDRRMQDEIISRTEDII